jgi:hypothetical protein
LEIFVLGVDHSRQLNDHGLKILILEIVEQYMITFIAEENRHLLNSIAKQVSESINLQWIQIDMSTEERIRANIYDKLANRMQIRGYDADSNPIMAIRYAPMEDGIREEFWLDRIEEISKKEKVLVICGSLHCVPFSAKARQRGHRILSKMFYPDELSTLIPELY